jgi:hypothetical protein
MSGSIAGNHLSLSIYRISSAEGLVRDNYGINKVAQLFGVNDLIVCIDLNTNGSEVEGGVFIEELVTSYRLLITKCNSLRRTIAGEGLPVSSFSRHGLMESSVACIGNCSGRSRRVGSQAPPPTTVGRGMGYWSLPSTNCCKSVETQHTM